MQSDMAIANYTLFDYDTMTRSPSAMTAEEVSQVADGLSTIVNYVTPNQLPLVSDNYLIHLLQIFFAEQIFSLASFLVRELSL
jgi:hypothetical protein